MTEQLPTLAGDRLAVRGISVHGHHGVFDFERREGQEFVIDVVLGVDTSGAARSDDLHDTVDYGTLVDQVRSAVANDPVDLIETLAQRIADVCLRSDQAADGEASADTP